MVLIDSISIFFFYVFTVINVNKYETLVLIYFKLNMDEIFQTINYFFKFFSPQLLLKNDGYVMTMKINIEYNKSFEIIKLKKKKILEQIFIV